MGPKPGFKENVKFFELNNFPERAEISLAFNPDLLDGISVNVVDLILSHKYRK